MICHLSHSRQVGLYSRTTRVFRVPVPFADTYGRFFSSGRSLNEWELRHCMRQRGGHEAIIWHGVAASRLAYRPTDRAAELSWVAAAFAWVFIRYCSRLPAFRSVVRLAEDGADLARSKNVWVRNSVSVLKWVLDQHLRDSSEKSEWVSQYSSRSWEFSGCLRFFFQGSGFCLVFICLRRFLNHLA